MSNLLQIQNLSVSFNKQQIINNISFQISKGEILAVVGTSGSGKSTLLNVIGNIITNYEGKISFLDKPLKSYICGYMPQNLGLWAWKTVRDNIFIANKIDNISQATHEEAIAIISELGIIELLDRYPSELSGGQQQRVSLARLFVSNPDILLMDEPFSALDTINAEISRELFLKLWRKRRITSIFSTHNLEEAIKLGKYILIISQYSGCMVELVENPLFDKELSNNEQAYFQMWQKLKLLMKK